MPDEKDISAGELVIHILNTGFGDTILVEFPAEDGNLREIAVIDCYKAKKLLDYLDKLSGVRKPKGTAFVCATHPHYDHVNGIRAILQHPLYKPREFWDAGFRHQSKTYESILNTVVQEKIRMVRVSSGMEWYYGTVRITALSPSVALRNRYATYGVDVNNASIVLRLENCKGDVVTAESERYVGPRDPEAEKRAGPAVVLLGGDAEFDSWAQIADEYRRVEATKAHEPLVRRVRNPLACSVVKVSHHGSMHSIPLDVYERMSPSLAVISTKQEVSSRNVGGRILSRSLFPHLTAVMAIEEVGSVVLTTDGSYEEQLEEDGEPRDKANAHGGTIVVAVPPGGRPRWRKLKDAEDSIPDPPTAL
jgi:beta-lactamase superfamily II metal-dependent hydrolase